MKKSQEILDKHLENSDVKHILEKYSVAYNACLNAIDEAINYSPCCKSDSEQLPDANKHQCNCSNAKDRLDCGFECYNK